MTDKTVLSRKAALAQGAVFAFLQPKLAKDAQIDLTPIFAGITGKNFTAQKPTILGAIVTATKGKLAKDAKLDDFHNLLDSVDKEEPAEGADADPATGLPMSPEDMQAKAMDAEGKADEFLKGKLSAEDMAAYDAMRGKKAKAMDETPEEKAAREAKEKKDGAGAADRVSKKAMDEAIADAVKIAQDSARTTAKQIRDAERDVRPYVGELAMAHDSAESIYRTALGALNVKVEGIDALPIPALKAILTAQPVPGSKAKATVAQDAASVVNFETRFPDAKRIGHA